MKVQLVKPRREESRDRYNRSFERVVDGDRRPKAKEPLRLAFRVMRTSTCSKYLISFAVLRQALVTSLLVALESLIFLNKTVYLQ